ncbi:MAG: endospore germination permease [Clostridia bacterium]|nr:endospore germination permease [Clostridia bacterium]
MVREKIANRQLLFILFMIRSTVVIATLPVLTTGEAAQDAWAAATLALLGSVVIVLMVGGLGTKFPSLTIVEYNQRLLGKYVGGLVSLAFLWLFLHIAATDTRVYAEVLVSGFLPLTPLTFITASMVILAALVVYLGIEVLGRMADVLMPFFTLFIALSIAGALRSVQPHNLEPVLARGLGPVISGAVTPIAISVQFLALAMLIPTLTIPEKATSSALVAATLAGIVLIVASSVVVGVLGPDLGSKAIFPFFEMVRSIEISAFLERIEALTVIAWGLGLFIDVATFLYCGAKGLAQLLGLRDYRILVGPLAAIWVLVAVYGYESLFAIMRFFSPDVIGPYVAAIFLGPYLLLWGTYIARSLLGKIPGQKGGQ